MSYVKTAYRGLDLLAAQDWQGAITELSTALESSPNPAWIIARSKALVGAGRFQEALRDAEHAWHEAASRSKRELIIDAQHRRAVAHYRLGELANADCCCLYAMRMLKGGRAIEPADQDPAVTLSGEGGLWTQRPADAKEQARLEEEAVDSISRPKSERGMEDSSAKTKQWRILSVLRQQILYALSQAPEDDLRAHKCTITQKPPQGELAKLNAASASAAAGSSSSSAAAASAAKTEAAPAALPITPKSAEVKLQEYQTNDTMNVTVLSKGVDKTKLKVGFQASVVTLDPIVYPDGREGTYTLHPWADIDPAGCSYGVTPSKVEVKLKKAAPGKWASITRDASTKTAAAAAAAPVATAAPSASKPNPEKPAASAAGPPKPAKNWDAIEYDQEEDESDVNGFFKKLYKNATPEAQRAMMKSFTESGGTSLSTDWDDVGKRTVEAVPPEGVEAKKW